MFLLLELACLYLHEPGQAPETAPGCGEAEPHRTGRCRICLRGCRFGCARHVAESSGGPGLIAPQVFGRHIVLRDLFRVNFSHVRVGGIFHAADRFGLEGLPLLKQFFDTQWAGLRAVR